MILNRGYIKNISLLLKGSIISQIIAIGSVPIITRVYNPDIFGQYSLIIAILSIVIPILTLKYDSALMLAEDDFELKSIFYLSFYISIFITLISILIIHVYLTMTDVYISIFNYVLIFLILLLSAIVNLFTAYNNRNGNYQLLAKVTVRRSLVQNLSSILLGSLYSTSSSLLTANLLSNLSGLKKQYAKTDIKIKLIPITKDRLKILSKFYRFPLYNLPTSIVNSLSFAILTIFIGSLYGLEMVGLYALAYKMLGLPISIISSNVSKVYYQVASSLYNNGESFKKQFNSTSGILIFISIIINGLVILFAERIFTLFFGEEWSYSAEIATILVPMFTIRMVVSALSSTMLIKNKQGLDLIIQSLFILSSLLSFITVLNLSLTIEFFLMLISATYSIIYLIYFIYIFKLSR